MHTKLCNNAQTQRVKARSVLCYWAVKELDRKLLNKINNVPNSLVLPFHVIWNNITFNFKITVFSKFQPKIFYALGRNLSDEANRICINTNSGYRWCIP